MINTKIVSLDQIIINDISYLIRGTSLSKKYLNHKKSKERDSKVISKKDDDTTTAIKEKKPSSLFSIDGINSLIDIILMKKPKDKDKKTSIEKENNFENNSNKSNGNHSVVISVNNDENTITISNLKTKTEKGKKKNLLFAKKKKEKIQDYLECILDQTKLEESDYIIKKGIITIPLHKSKKYSINANDENIA